MAIDFPDSPSNNDIYTVNGKRWIYSNGKWSIYGSTAPDATASDTEPTGVGDGHIWYRSDQSQTLIRYDNTWVEVGSAGGFDSSSTSFPASLDSATGFAAVEALQAKVGVDGSAVTTSHDYILTNGVLPTLNVNSGVLVVDDSNNRVGVNDASPSYALDVTGDINASSDIKLAGDSMPRGVLMSQRNTGAIATIGAGVELAFFNTGSFTPVAGRKYAITYSVGFCQKITGDGDLEVRLRLGSTTSGTLLDSVVWSGFRNTYSQGGTMGRTVVLDSTLLGTSATDILVSVYTNTNSGFFTNAAAHKGYLIVEDIGT